MVVSLDISALFSLKTSIFSLFIFKFIVLLPLELIVVITVTLSNFSLTNLLNIFPSSLNLYSSSLFELSSLLDSSIPLSPSSFVIPP